MRFMVFVKAPADSEAGVMPDASMLVAMGRFNNTHAARAGLLLKLAPGLAV
ncbi:MAG: hypothetical protein KA795_00190 [Burkholderiaceae bacterium]|nr:hypothetical protein [Burkholderiaceae bacterium]